MDNNEGGSAPPLWNAHETHNHPLRKPEARTITNPESATVSKFKPVKLDPEAQEYVPANKQYKQPQKGARPQAQDRLNKLKDNELSGGMRTDDFHELQGLIVSVTNVPGQFEDLIDSIMSAFERFSANDNVVMHIANFIFNQAVNEPSFRYNGARLCALIEEGCQYFGVCLHELCRNEVHNNLCRPGLTLFLAELCVQIGAENSAENLYLSINKLLNNGGDDNVKAVCQSLKLSGNMLESYNKDQMDVVFKKLEGLKSAVRDNIKHLMESVVTLRQNNWGQDASFLASSSMPNNSNQNNYESSYYYQENYFDNLDDPDELYDPEPEMDEEIQLAFREFVKLSK